MGEKSNEYAVKVVIINTEYIETDARSFKAVVQRLTGKDSKVEVAVKQPPSPPPPPAAAAAGFNGQGKRHSGDEPHWANDFDCDRLVFNKELSPLDELYALYAQ